MKRKKNKGIKLSQSTPFPLGAKLRAVDGPYDNEIIVNNYVLGCNPVDVHDCKCPSKGTMIEDKRGLRWCIYQDRYSNRNPAVLKWKLIGSVRTKCKSILKEKIKAILASKSIPIYKRKLTHGKD